VQRRGIGGVELQGTGGLGTGQVGAAGGVIAASQQISRDGTAVGGGQQALQVSERGLHAVAALEIIEATIQLGKGQERRRVRAVIAKDIVEQIGGGLRRILVRQGKQAGQQTELR